MRYLGLGLVLMALAGCRGENNPGNAATTAGKPPEPDSATLKPFLLAAKPDKVKSLIDVRDKGGNGETVVFEGTFPPATTKPFNSSRAAFTVMDAKDLAVPEINDELQCEDAAT